MEETIMVCYQGGKYVLHSTIVDAQSARSPGDLEKHIIGAFERTNQNGGLSLAIAKSARSVLGSAQTTALEKIAEKYEEPEQDLGIPDYSIDPRIYSAKTIDPTILSIGFEMTYDKRITKDTVREEFCKRAVVEWGDLVGKKQTREIADPRHVLMYVYRQKFRHSFPEIGQIFGNRDHSTVMSGIRRVRRQIEDYFAIK